MTTRDLITEKLSTAFAPESVKVVDESQQHVGHAGHRPGGETHFRVYIVSEAFRGKSRLECHRMINATLGSELQRRRPCARHSCLRAGRRRDVTGGRQPRCRTSLASAAPARTRRDRWTRGACRYLKFTASAMSCSKPLTLSGSRADLVNNSSRKCLASQLPRWPHGQSHPAREGNGEGNDRTRIRLSRTLRQSAIFTPAIRTSSCPRRRSSTRNLRNSSGVLPTAS